jgi:hypothetical protein
MAWATFWAIFPQTHLVALILCRNWMKTIMRSTPNDEYFFPSNQGCQMVYFQNKNFHLGKFWRVFQWKMLVYFMAIWSNLRPFGTFYDGHLVYFTAIWYIFWPFGIVYGYWYIFPFWYFTPIKIWQPCSKC